MRALVIAATDVRRMLRDRTGIFFIFIFPMLLILLLGTAFGGGGTSRLAVVSLGDGGLAQELVRSLDADEELAVVRYDHEGAAVDAVSRGRVSAGVVIPARYDERLRRGEAVEVGYIARPDPSSQLLEARVAQAVSEQSAILRAVRVATDAGAADYAAALERAGGVGGQIPGMTVSVERLGSSDPLEEEFAGLGRFDLGASQQLLLFVFLTSLSSASVLIQARQLGLTRRMLASPTATRTVLVGQGLGRFGVALVQGGYIVVGTLLLYDVNWGSPVAAAAILVVFATVSAAAGMLLGAVFSNDSQAGGMAVLFGLALAAIGGCMAPIEIFSPTMRVVAHVTPHAWAMDAFAETVRRGGGLLDILPELGILAAYAAVLLTVGTWRLHRVTVRT